MVYIQDNLGWSLGFGLCVVTTLVSVFFFSSSDYRIYRHKKPQGNAILELGKVFVASLLKWKCQLSSRAEDYYQHVFASSAASANTRAKD
ncbi:putative proton-dependent oligopeptide transporter family [Medicago truncatula]|uniref:Peptide/nitrate transporter n=1 Tax=Medicago truncatula TaxID=3880 RepID=A0A072U4X8_MEDTR|nr:peptide/nitrate transporter [Medicago truncatula]RHN42956.1 putative proton-dependent oligopeptide transporter family [Medicago truncatula]